MGNGSTPLTADSDRVFEIVSGPSLGELFPLTELEFETRGLGSVRVGVREENLETNQEIRLNGVALNVQGRHQCVVRYNPDTQSGMLFFGH